MKKNSHFEAVLFLFSPAIRIFVIYNRGLVTYPFPSATCCIFFHYFCSGNRTHLIYSDKTMELKQGATLQGGKYTIKRMLGQGGFGITYLGIQTGLGRQVAIKEFFMKEHCNRDASTSRVSVGSSGARQMVDAYRQKFLKEARTLAEMDNRHIVRIHDVFEENDTAYYVMEYVDGGSLNDLVKRRGSLPEAEALGYIRQLADALAYIHGRRIMHLDVKPGNIMLRPDGELVLIDFGIAKHYDSGNHETSGTPVGHSPGYAPMEQYQEGGVCEFSPATDIYSMGATLYFLLTTTAPPSAQEVYENGLPPLPRFVSPAVCRAIEQAMQPSRKKRLQSVAEFLALLPGAEGKKKEETPRQSTVEEETIPPIPPSPHNDNPVPPSPNAPASSRSKWIRLAFAITGAILGLVLWELISRGLSSDTSNTTPTYDEWSDTGVVEEEPVLIDSIAYDTAVSDSIAIDVPEEESSPVTYQKQVSQAPTSAELFEEALRLGDMTTLRMLAGKGYAPAYAKLATYYLQRDEYDNAETYARKALDAREGVNEAWRVVEVLDGYGYYHNGDHGGKPAKNR